MRRSRVARALLLLLLLAGLGAPASASAVTKVMVVGDSISQGSAGDFTWRYRLWKNLQSTAPGAVDLVGDRTALFDNVTNVQGSTAYADPAFDTAHHALWGRALKDEKATIGAATTSAAPDVILVLLGTNDLTYLSSPTQAAADMRSFIAAARAARPGVDFVLGHVPTRYDLFGATYQLVNESKAFNTELDSIASTSATTQSRILTAAVDSGWDPKIHTWDGTHPNTVGEARIAAAFANALAKWGIGTGYGAVPTSIAWPIAGKKPSVTPVDSGASLTWAGAPGATGAFIELRNVTLNGAWQRLPYAVSGGAFTAGLLVPGMDYQFRTVPSKGTMTGQPGPASATVRILGKTPAKPGRMRASITDQHSVALFWDAAADASGYVIESTDLATMTVTRLPYPVAGTTFSPGLLVAGHWYRWRVIPVNGAIEGTPSDYVDTRTKGVSPYSAYFALGDSYSAGTGDNVAGYLSPAVCERSPTTWAFQLDAGLGFVPRPTMIACGGAITNNIWPQSAFQGVIQHPEVQSGTQQELLENGRPSNALVTISIGGNDTGFSDLVKACIGTGACASRKQEIADKIDFEVEPKLVKTYRLLALAAPGADLIAVGYPRPVSDPAKYGCYATLAGLNDTERQVIRYWADHLNTAIYNAALATGFYPITGDIVSAFSGHEVCSTDGEWINGPSLPLNASFHPNHSGSTAYAIGVNNGRNRLYSLGFVRYP